MLDLEALNLEFARWLAIKANARIHGTTGEIPADRLTAEQPALQVLPPRLLGGQTRLRSTDRVPITRFPVESLQHSLSVYDDLLEAV